MKLTIKIALVISLFCATAFAGEQGNGGFCGEQGNGGICVTNNPTEIRTIDAEDQGIIQDDILFFVRDLLVRFFG